MPKKSPHSALSRLLDILKRLPTKGSGITTRDLQLWLKNSGYDVSRRTVERDLAELAARFPLYCNDKGKPNGWLWAADGAPAIPGLTMAESLSLSLIEDLLRPLLPGAVFEPLQRQFVQARRNLVEQAKTNPRARWPEKVRYLSPAMPLMPPKIEDGVLAIIQEALLADLQVDATYQKRPGAEEPMEMRIHPLGLVQRGPVTYLVATVFNYTDVRIMAVHRIRSASMCDEPARRPEGFTLDKYIREGALHFGNGKIITLVAQVSEGLAGILEETPLAENQRIKKDGRGYRVIARIEETQQLRWWILSQGESLEVLKPIRLRREIGETLKRASMKYQGQENLIE